MFTLLSPLGLWHICFLTHDNKSLGFCDSVNIFGKDKKEINWFNYCTMVYVLIACELMEVLLNHSPIISKVAINRKFSDS